jgi:hypothetical protein
MIKRFFSRLFTARDYYKDIKEAYLAESTDLVDLERRVRQMDRGQAPWQQQNKNLNGWV